MKIALDAGHGCSPDTGASGVGGLEDNLTQDVVTKLASLLKDKHDVILVRPSAPVSSVQESLSKRTSHANSIDANLYVSIHFNAFNTSAKGTEVFAVSPQGQQVAKSVVNEVSALGFFNRGVKDGSNLFVLKNTNMPAILVECCFIDCKSDISNYSGDKMASAIAKGIESSIAQW